MSSKKNRDVAQELVEFLLKEEQGNKVSLAPPKEKKQL